MDKIGVKKSLNISKNIVNKILLLSIMIFGFGFFDLNLISTTIANGFVLFSILIIIFGVLLTRKSKLRYNFKKLIYLFAIGILINFIMMYFYNKLSLYDSLFVLLNYLGLLLYFFLHKFKFSEKSIINIVFIIALIVSFLMILQQIVKPIPLFNQLALHIGYLNQRGTARVRIPGMALVVFSYLLYMYYYIKSFKIKYLIFCLFFAIIIIMQGFRSITLALILCSVYIYWYSSQGKYKISVKKIISFSILIVIFFIFFMQIDYVRNIIVEMFLQVNQDKKIGDNNVRVFSFIYYLITIKQEFWMYFTGNGLKIPFKTPKGLFAVDLGIFGFFALAGIIPVYALLKSFIKGVLLSKKLKYLVPSAFFLYILLNSFLFNAEAFRTGIFLVYSISFYLIDLQMDKLYKDNLTI